MSAHGGPAGAGSARVPVVLTVAGSDPSGGAGVQADLKTFSALGAYGCAVLTSLTAQSTRGVTGIHPVPAGFVTDQLATLLEDVRVDAVKIGMLGTASVADAVADVVRRLDCPVVLDPVMVSTAGSRLLDADAVEAVRRLVAMVDLVTPNGPEAGVLAGAEPPRDLAGQRAMAAALHERLGARVLLKGGHVDGAASTDVLAGPGGAEEFTAPRVATRNTHGTGCTLSSAVAALRPQRAGWTDAVADAKAYLTAALEHADALDVGAGPGPVHHFHALWG
ncbi:bifunctional hydroxymethylpyrimidine kinase/phosphomethylpyrimidine kinase [Kytococcus schroeteri]|uniref:bifunctional hydroxymethylpyrimidine kinase/phosphomethylpyrimidine kinase n=1 Tax=Kytococcus schroeteri TaxID=138300 RepID=UPI001EDDBC15|nr:bifunctional hydroxymethylpyrimidine kinase/phosphomethylpyrimidine kinase [Kytococcus schroeteri]